MQLLPQHSPLGASGSYRWINCPGSVQLSEGVEDPESEHAALGTGAHSLGAYCLQHGQDAWECIGAYASNTHGICGGEPGLDYLQVDKPMADAVQVYLDAIRREYPSIDRHQEHWIERRFHCPSIHRLMFGTSDFTYLDRGDRRLDVWDYKHGAGIVVEVENNPQLKYYGAGMLEELGAWDEVDRVVMRIVQPRGFHPDGDVREWSISTADLRAWVDGALVPAMDRALVSNETASGEHCRFCPARRHACPQLMADLTELEGLMAEMEKRGGAPKLTNDEIARILNLGEIFKIQHKAARETGYQRAQGGASIPGWKLARARSNREWKEGAEALLVKKFGAKKVYTEPKLKSPAQVDELPEGKAFTAEHAFKPDAGMQLVPASDARADVGPSVRSMFKPVTKEGSKRKKT